METISTIIQSKFKKIQAQFRIVSITHLDELRTELTTWKQEGNITEKFYTQNYGFFVFSPPPSLRNAKSIIIIGIPQKIIPVEFYHQGKRYTTAFPPTYLYSHLRTVCKETLSSVLGKKGYSVEQAILPMKLLAVRSGLAKYGKNNLCYVDGMGSFTRLEGFYTDYEFPTDDWYGKKLMKACEKCTLCHTTCPTQCIPRDRILLHADRCLTYLNENQGDFPAWLAEKSHNALVGCLKCQIVCPQNKQYLQFEKSPLIFTEEEMLSILEKTPHSDLPPNLRKKLTDYDLDDYYDLLQRNLSVLMKQ